MASSDIDRAQRVNLKPGNESFVNGEPKLFEIFNSRHFLPEVSELSLLHGILIAARHGLLTVFFTDEHHGYARF